MYKFHQNLPPQKKQTQSQYSRKNPFKIENFLNLTHYQSNYHNPIT